MRLLAKCIVLAATASVCFGQVPDIYKRIGRVTWVVKSLDAPVKGWSALGMTDVREHGSVSFQGQYRGKAVTGMARAATGSLGNLAVDMIQPVEGDNAFTAFHAKHGDGIFSIVFEVPSEEALQKEVARMRGFGVGVLQTVSVDGGPEYTFFDTEAQGKYVLGLVYWPGAPAAGTESMVSHVAFVIRDPRAVSAYWEKLGFPAMPVSHASPREDSRYHGTPLLLSFDVGWHRYSQPTFEWIIPPQTPPNCYADTIKMHGEGVHHLGMPIKDLDETIAAYKKLGHGVLQSGAWGDVGKPNSGRYGYMDTDAIGGVTAEVIQEYK